MLFFSYANIAPSSCKNLNYCGNSLESATQCQNLCPSGSSAECPGDMTCFTNINARECEVMNYCGVSEADAKTCFIPCPAGLSSECPAGLQCYTGIQKTQCDTILNSDPYKNDDIYYDDVWGINDPTYDSYCGTSLEDAKSCGESCGLTGLDSECSDGEFW